MNTRSLYNRDLPFSVPVLPTFGKYGGHLPAGLSSIPCLQSLLRSSFLGATDWHKLRDIPLSVVRLLLGWLLFRTMHHFQRSLNWMEGMWISTKSTCQRQGPEIHKACAYYVPRSASSSLEFPQARMEKKCSPNDSFQRLSRVSFLCRALSQSPLYTSVSPSGKWHTSLDAWFAQRFSCNDDVYEGTCQLRIILPYCSLLCAIHTKHMSVGFKSRREAWMKQAERELASLPVIEFLIYSLLFSILSFRPNLARTAWDKMKKENNWGNILSFSCVDLMICTSVSET